jgi:two-component system alkaline phosphatase synthesis response regulator PhoP
MQIHPTRRSPMEPTQGESATTRPSSVLVVDDNLQNLELLQAYLEELGCPVRTAHDGLECLREVEALQPDLILLDVMMPRMSGFQACEKLKASPATRDIPIIMVTALNEVSDVEKALECGANDFLTKPVNKLELLTRAKSLLGFRILKRERDHLLDRLRRLERPGTE